MDNVAGGMPYSFEFSNRARTAILWPWSPFAGLKVLLYGLADR